MSIKRYSELIQIRSFEERFNYLRLGGSVGLDTFGSQRYLNQEFYRSKQWKDFRNKIIVRDSGCDLACSDHPIASGEKIYIHHLNPVTIDDFINGSDSILDPENAITTTFDTHQAIHYGDKNYLRSITFEERTPFDTCPWKLPTKGG